MTIAIQSIYETKNKSSVTNSVKTNENNSLFNYKLEQQGDAVIQKELWNENTKSVLYDAVQSMGIGAYSPSVLNSDNVAIAKSQRHLIDMVKYYEGDKNYYYESFTTPYKDKYGTTTCGFGELTDKPMTQEQAYQRMCDKLKAYAKEVENLLNKKIGNNAYASLPKSIKEALIDLCYNKGLGKISSNSALLNAIKNKDYSKIVANLAYVYSGKSNAQKVEDPGLYRRSLNRLILACRDLKGQELQEARIEVKTLYNKAKVCHEKNNSSTVELDKIYEQFTTGKISAKAISAASSKIIIDESFKGKGLLNIAQVLYKSVGSSKDITFEEFFEEIKRLNNNPDSIKVGQELKVPVYIKQVSQNKNANTKEVEKPSLWSRFVNGVVSVFKKIGNFIKSLFTSEEKKEVKKSENLEIAKTPFQKMLANANITQDGEFQIVSIDYKIQKGDNIGSIAKNFGTSEDIICNDNGIKDKNKIAEGQSLKIQKLGYKVKQGDNLTQIAKKFGLSVEIIKDINNIDDVNQIQVGQILEIPGFIYNVQPKDNLTKISKLMGVELEDLMKINGLQSADILPNQKLKIVYNDSDYSVSSDKKKVTVDEKTNTKTEVIDMSSYANLKNRPLLKNKVKINNQVAVTKKVFNPTKNGKLSGKTIIVNAGHGYSQAGIDPGAIGKAGMEDEWLINYDNAMRLKDRLCAQGAKVIFMQGHVNLITNELKKRNDKADMFISVHVNSYEGDTKDRTQIYYSENKLPVKEKSKKLASIMEKKFDSWIPRNEKINNNDKFYVKNEKDKNVQDFAQAKDADYGVIREAEKNYNIPSVLWEVAFMAAPKGRERMKNSATMNSYSDLMVQAVMEYFKV